MSTHKVAPLAILHSVEPPKIKPELTSLVVTATSRSQRAVIDFLIKISSIDIFIRNNQNESVYDIAAERADLTTCEQIEPFERTQWATRYPNGISYSPQSWPFLANNPNQSSLIQPWYTMQYRALSLKMHV